jgi:uncharacterized protein with beta-barrel porin domain
MPDTPSARADSAAAAERKVSLPRQRARGKRSDRRAAALQAQQFRTPSYVESATSGSNAFALAYNSNATTATRTELGAWFDKTFALNSTSLITLQTCAAGANDHSSSRSVNAVFQTLPGSNFTVNGAAVAPNSAPLSAGAEIKLANNVSVGAKFDGEFANSSKTYAGTGTVRYA